MDGPSPINGPMPRVDIHAAGGPNPEMDTQPLLFQQPADPKIATPFRSVRLDPRMSARDL